MKRCPECRCDYYDDSLLYCLEDGTALIQGLVPSRDEPATAILSTAASTGEGNTLRFASTQERLGPAKNGAASGRNSIIAGVAGFILITILGIGSYLLYGRTSAKQIDSIAVMPFLNESGNGDLDYLSDGMTETLIRGLSQLPNLNVKSRSSVFRYKGKDTDARSIGKELGVQAVLNGRIVQ